MAENDESVSGSPFWWMKRMLAKQAKRRPEIDKLQAWLDNDPPLPESAPQWQEATQTFYKSSRTNFADLTVESARERMTALGFRTGAAQDENGDAVAAKAWADNHMPAQQVDLFGDMLGLRAGYTMVAPDEASGKPIITVEDPRQTLVVRDPTRPWLNRAGCKMYHDPEEDLDVFWLYVQPDAKHNPRQVTAYRATRKAPGNGRTIWGTRFLLEPKQWEWDDPKTMPCTRVPIVEFLNRHGLADFESNIPLLERLNRQTLQRMLIAELQAFRQRAVEGLPSHWPDEPTIPEHLRGKEIDYEGLFTPGPGALWQLPPGAKFWESQPIDLRPLIEAERHDIRTYMALTRIPISYLTPDDANGSAEGASLQREGLIYRIEDRQTLAGDRLAMTMSLYFEQAGDSQRSEIGAIEPIWSPIERLSLNERYNAANLASGFMPRNTIMREVLQFTPKQMERAEDDAAGDFMLNALPQQQVPSERSPVTGAPATPPVSV